MKAVYVGFIESAQWQYLQQLISKLNMCTCINFTVEQNVDIRLN